MRLKYQLLNILPFFLFLTVPPVYAGDYREKGRSDYRSHGNGKHEEKPSGDYYVVPRHERYRRLEPLYQQKGALRVERYDRRHDGYYGDGKRHGHGGRGRR